VLEEFTLGTQVERFAELYERVVNGPGPAGIATSPRQAAIEPEGERGPALRILAVAPLSWKSGLEYGLHAVRLLLDRGVDCELRILGDGGYADAVNFARHQLGLESATLVLSAETQRLEPLLGWADVLLDAAVSDDVPPLVAAGLPVVSSREHGRRNPHALADALESADLDAEQAEVRRIARPAH
jgi:glycosyltransferase involved in cell wall biosynthesis